MEKKKKPEWRSESKVILRVPMLYIRTSSIVNDDYYCVFTNRYGIFRRVRPFGTRLWIRCAKRNSTADDKNIIRENFRWFFFLRLRKI